MRLVLLWIPLMGLLAATGASAASGYNSSAISATYSGSGVVGAESHGIPELNAYRKHRAIEAVVQEGRQMQRADGRALTAEHHAYLQAKLKAILAGNY
jgi:hypothetical protein